MGETTDAAASAAPTVDYLGVYDADGGVVGEVSYVIGHLLGRAECALCDITHTWRRKPAWDAMVARLGASFALAHRNEVTDAAAQAVIAETGLPVVLARDRAGGWRAVLRRADLERAGGSVDQFERMLLGTRGAGPSPPPPAQDARSSST
ncbi:hypothetical protein [Agromyces indicus]|uniref:Uncharacterized protein n=1 Tax=Agromyces indicus TaxID=758919 RepID=A0ABU1FNR4_9MICO|nr:hypothetical protein [Agromyces indicus]MDR5692925.1 hypothetical protein [Agromyces indicus]